MSRNIFQTFALSLFLSLSILSQKNSSTYAFFYVLDEDIAGDFEQQKSVKITDVLSSEFEYLTGLIRGSEKKSWLCESACLDILDKLALKLDGLTIQESMSTAAVIQAIQSVVWANYKSEPSYSPTREIFLLRRLHRSIPDLDKDPNNLLDKQLAHLQESLNNFLNNEVETISGPMYMDIARQLAYPYFKKFQKSCNLSVNVIKASTIHLNRAKTMPGVLSIACLFSGSVHFNPKKIDVIKEVKEKQLLENFHAKIGSFEDKKNVKLFKRISARESELNDFFDRLHPGDREELYNLHVSTFLQNSTFLKRPNQKTLEFEVDVFFKINKAVILSKGDADEFMRLTYIFPKNLDLLLSEMYSIDAYPVHNAVKRAQKKMYTELFCVIGLIKEIKAGRRTVEEAHLQIRKMTTSLISVYKQLTIMCSLGLDDVIGPKIDSFVRALQLEERLQTEERLRLEQQCQTE